MFRTCNSVANVDSHIPLDLLRRLEAHSPVIMTWVKAGLVESVTEYLANISSGEGSDTFARYGEYKTRALLTDNPTGLARRVDLAGKEEWGGQLQSARLLEHEKSCFLLDDKGDPQLVDIPIE